MQYVEVRTHRRAIGRIEIRNTMKERRGRTKYEVGYELPNGIRVQTHVWHIKNQGALKLVMIVARKLHKELDRFFSLPKDKIVNGTIKRSDITKRYVEELGKFLGVHTGAIIDGETATFVSDIEGWLNMMKTGAVPVWD